MNTKLSSTLLFFFICNTTYSQKINPTQLQSFAGKQVTSIIETTVDTRSSTIGITDKNIETIPTGRKQTTTRLINFQKDGQQIKATFTIQHIKATIYGGAGESIYDSDNTFERSGIAATFATMIDPVVGKKFVVKSDNAGRIATPINDKSFEQVWGTGVSKINSNTELSGIFQASALASGWIVGKMWADTLNSSKNVFVNAYTITEIKDGIVKITFKGNSKPIVGNQDKGSIYNGTLEVVKATGFIQKLESERESEVISEAMGTKISSITTTKTIVVNKIK